MEKDYGEVFCQAVDTIVGERLQGLSFDQTVLCNVVDDSKREQGIYIVSNNGGLTKFIAYSENTSYRENNNVYVQIPGGDWDQQKTIVSKKTDNIEEPYIYKSPLSALVDITGNIIHNNIESKLSSLVANGELESVLLWAYNFDQIIADAEMANRTPLRREEGEPIKDYTRLGLQAGFKSWLNPFYLDDESVARYVTNGNYGLRLKVYTNKENISKDEETKQAVYIMELDCGDMNGNPYDFESFYQQEKLFDISSIGQINAITLEFFQDRGTFSDSVGNLIPSKDFLGNEIISNLFANDIYVSCGYDINEFDDEMVRVYTLDSATYSRTASPLTNNHKTLHLRWIHKQDNGEFKSITMQDILGQYTVKWYRYELGLSSADEYSGVYWKELSIQETSGNNSVYEIKDADWIAYNNGCDAGFRREPSFFSTWAIPDTTAQTERYKAIVFYNGEPYRSNILECTNEDEVINKSTIDAVQALSINCEDSTYGNYRIYNQGNSLLDLSNSAVVRTWKPFFKSSTGGDDVAPTELIEAESIEWVVPWQKTMIVLDKSYYENNSEYWFELKDGTIVQSDRKKADGTDAKDSEISRIHIKRRGTRYEDSTSGKIFQNSLVGDGTLKNNLQNYRIRSYYSQTNGDNIIQCKVVKENITYTATKEMTFGVAGTTGTDCTFILDFDNGITAVSPEDAEKGVAVSVTARLYDYENNEIDLEEYFSQHDGVSITWTWKEDTLSQNIQIDGNYNGVSGKIISVSLTYKNNKSDIGANYNILSATLKGWGTYDLTAYLPIPIRADTSYNYISGTTQVIYNSDGSLIDYFKNPYILYQNAGPVKDSITWSCKNNDIAETESGFTPVIKVASKTGEQYLSPLSFYIDETCKNICVIAKDKDEKVLWSQPLLIMINRYPSAMVNGWDGGLKINEKDGWVLTPRLVAGKKDENNTFSGVMLGDFSKTDSDVGLTSNDTGLYGYYKGQQSYAFKQDGTAFIGKSGAARINFDGQTGKICSSGYDAGKGMLIDLTQNIIEAKTNENNIIFKLSSNEPYLQINSKLNKTLMNIGDDSYYLKSANYAGFKYDKEKSYDGTYIDLTTGDIYAKNGTFNGDINIKTTLKNDEGEIINSFTTLSSVLTTIQDQIDGLKNTQEAINSYFGTSASNFGIVGSSYNIDSNCIRIAPKNYHDSWCLKVSNEGAAMYNSDNYQICNGDTTGKWFVCKGNFQVTGELKAEKGVYAILA